MSNVSLIVSRVQFTSNVWRPVPHVSHPGVTSDELVTNLSRHIRHVTSQRYIPISLGRSLRMRRSECRGGGDAASCRSV